MHPGSAEVLHSMRSALLKVFEANCSVACPSERLTSSKTWLQNTLLFCASSEQACSSYLTSPAHVARRVRRRPRQWGSKPSPLGKERSRRERCSCLRL